MSDRTPPGVHRGKIPTWVWAVVLGAVLVVSVVALAFALS